MPDDSYPKLTDTELLTLCGTLLRAMRVDRAVTRDECDAIVSIVAELSAPPGVLGPTSAPAGGVTDGWSASALALIDRATQQFPDDASLRGALAAITRPDVQRLIYDAVFSLASIDTVSSAEEGFLEDLAATWGLKIDGAGSTRTV